MRVAVVGHVEWVEFARVDAVPRPGEIVHASETWEEAAGGGAVAAVQLTRLAGSCSLFTMLGADELGRRSQAELTRLDAVYFVSGDAEALHHARLARVLVATARELATVREAGVELDALVGSGEDDSEIYHPGDLDPAPRVVVTTSGALGGWVQPGGPFRPAPLPGPVVDAYGCGDSFAAGLTFALARGDSVEQAVALAARCGAAVMTGKGPYTGQIDAAALEP